MKPLKPLDRETLLVGLFLWFGLLFVIAWVLPAR